MMGLIYLMLIKPAKERSKKRRDPLNKPPTKTRSLAAERSTEREMQRLVLDLEALSRRMGGELDAKAAKLEALIEQANDAADRLERQKRSVPDVPLPPAVPADGGLAGLDSHSEIYRLADAGEAADAIARKVDRPRGEVELILALRER
jgi:hypothetical protein